MAVDPWGSYNAGMQQLGETFSDIRKERKEAPLKALQLRMLEQKAQEGDIALEQAKVSAADKLRLRGIMEKAQPTTEQVYSADKFAMPQPALSQNAALYAKKPAAEALTTLPGQEFTQPTEGQITTKTTPPNLAEIARQELLKQGRFKEAKEVGETQLQNFSVDKALAEAKAKGMASGNLDQYYRAKLEADAGKDIIATVAPLTKTHQGRVLAQTILDGYKKVYPNLQSIQAMTLDNFKSDDKGDSYEVKSPTGQPIGHYVRNPETGDLTFQKVEKAQETWGEPYKTEVGGKIVMLQKSSTGQVRPVVQDVSTTIVDRRQMFGERPKPAKPLPAGQLESLADARKMIDNLEEAKKLSSQVSTGPISGRVQSAAAIVGKAPKKFVEFKQKIATVNNIMLKLRSGAAVTEQEYSRFLQEMPTANDAPETRDIKLQGAINYANDLVNEKALNFEEGGYKVPEHVKQNRIQAKQNKSDPLGIR